MAGEAVATLSPLGKAAVEYATEYGFGLIPLRVRGKEPVTVHGLNDWQDDPDGIADFWAGHPENNIGIVCGEASGGLVVIDVDVDEDKDKDGMAVIREWEKKHGELPQTVTAITGRGGIHYFYRTDRRISPTVSQELSVDIRGEGSYVVAPPSVHPNGRRYAWQDYPEETPVAEADDNVLALIQYVQDHGAGTRLDGEAKKFVLPETIGEGGRNRTLYGFACQRRAFGDTEEEVMEALIKANKERCHPSLPVGELRTICAQACKFERGLKEGEGLPNVTRPGGAGGGVVVQAPIGVTSFRNSKGRIVHNKLGRLLIERNHACRLNGMPAVWTGTSWAIGLPAVNRCILGYADDAKTSDRREVIEYIMATMPSRDVIGDFDGKAYVQFANCTVEAATLSEVSPTPEMLVANVLPIFYDRDADTTVAEEFLASVSGDDENVALVLTELIGACMTASRATSQAAMLVGRAQVVGGEASNGKSTYLNMLQSLLGAENVSSLDMGTLGERFQAARMAGKLANIADDIPSTFLEGNELSNFKKIVTGDTLYTDVKNGTGFEFRPMAQQIFSMNEVPRLKETNEGILRRLAFVPFNAVFRPGMPGFDPHIIRKLTTPEALRGFALLGMASLGPLAERGFFTNIEGMAEELRQVQVDNDSVLRWIEDDGVTVSWCVDRTATAVYEAYSEWCAKSGERNPFSKVQMTRRLLKAFSDHGLKSVTRRFNENGKTGKPIRVFGIDTDEARVF